ncbi:MAG: prepilin-type N-terminal cleavage/methylation domain-containing protein [Verrucomicrobia bacterium]|nr:prepilin-type N-terminal cleavage/methylation domain-containing protein [Verrucomicrobiota bacterium]
MIACLAESQNAFTTKVVLKTTRRVREAAFTLMEVLIVVAIVAILAAILVPVAGKMSEAGRATKCMSNLRQLHSVLMLYANDNNQMLPSPDVNASPDSQSATHWFRRLDPYIPQQDRMKILTCPSAKGFQAGGWATAYGMNYYLGKDQDWQTLSVEQKSQVILLADAIINPAWHSAASAIFEDGGPFTKTVDLRHRGKANFLFLDGHVEASEEYSKKPEYFYKN